jgi:O-antigen/teichoic acid export membrane protein
MSLKKHSLIYFLGRSVPGIINFIAIAIYTRLLSPEEYGVYALAFSTVLLMNTIIYQWIRMSLLRLLPAVKNDRERNELSASLGIGFILSSFVALLTALVFFYLFQDNTTYQNIVFPALLLLWLYGLFEIALEYYRSKLKPKKYVVSFNFKTIIALVLGVVLAYFGFGPTGLIFSLLIAIFLTTILNHKEFLRFFFRQLNHFNAIKFRHVLAYGLPFTLTFGMNFIFNSSDRFFINYFLGESSTGIYAVGYDFARQSLWVLFVAINLGSFPLVIKALEEEGETEVRVKLEENLILLLIVLVPATFGLMVFSDDLVQIFLGNKFSGDVANIVPLIAFGTLILGIKNFYFDQSFQIMKKTTIQVIPVLLAAVINVILNLFIIEWLGLMGAVYSTLVSFVVALVSSILISNKFFKMPFPIVKVLKIFTAGLIMYFFIILLKLILGNDFIYFLFVISPLFYFFALWVLKIEEIKLFTNKIYNFKTEKNKIKQ